MKKNRDGRIFCSVMNYDEFQGFSIPKEMKHIVEYIQEKTGTDYIDNLFDDYDEYRDYEVECASQARHGSRGTEDIDTIEEFKEYFDWLIRDNKEVKEYFDKISPVVIKEKILNPVKSSGITGWTY